MDGENTNQVVCTVAIAGLGSRGFHTYAACAKIFPDKMKLVAGADIRRERLDMIKTEYHIPEEMCFDSAEEMLKQERLADIMIICTQDRQHVPHAIEAMRKGYHIILEKPIAPDLQQCAEIVKVAEETERKIIVCHVLRYTPFYNKLKELLDAGTIGEIVSIQHTENVRFYHHAHSFVRGNWRRSDETSPMILAKCCHDMDLLLWLSGKHCQAVSSYGNTYLFKPEMAPEGAAKRCTEQCKAKEQCPYDAEKIYISDKKMGITSGNTGWPVDVLVSEPTPEAVREALMTGPYGRCVFACDNDVVDHQVVNMQMDDGASFQLLMSAFTSRGGRDTKIMGTQGEIVARLQENTICVMPFGKESYTIDVRKLASDFSGHAGGDNRMVEEFLDMVSGRIQSTVRTTSLKDSVESHIMALAAELSRIEGGRSVRLSELL